MTPAMTYLGKSLASIDRSIDYIIIDLSLTILIKIHTIMAHCSYSIVISSRFFSIIDFRLATVFSLFIPMRTLFLTSFRSRISFRVSRVSPALFTPL